MSGTPRDTVHASCLVLGEAGILLRGEAGAGKSTLVLRLLDRAAQAGVHGALVGDDRLRLTARHGRLVARPHPALAGLVEIRGIGLSRTVAPLDAAVIRLVVDLVSASERLPESATHAELLGVRLRRLTLDRALRDAGLCEGIVVGALAAQGFDGSAKRPTDGVAAWPHSLKLAPAHPLTM